MRCRWRAQNSALWVAWRYVVGEGFDAGGVHHRGNSFLKLPVPAVGIPFRSGSGYIAYGELRSITEAPSIHLFSPTMLPMQTSSRLPNAHMVRARHA